MILISIQDEVIDRSGMKESDRILRSPDCPGSREGGDRRIMSGESSIKESDRLSIDETKDRSIIGESYDPI